MGECERSAYFGKKSAAALKFFTSLYEDQTEETKERPSSVWDRCADAWELERKEGRREARDGRLLSTVEYLKSRGLLTAKQDVADIGCGPGRFAAEFAKTARSVAGFDISEKMIRYGKTYAAEEGLENISFCQCDFRTLDVKKEGLFRRFDLVFSSLTPALQRIEELRKAMEFSRAFCFHISHISSSRSREEAVVRELFGRKPKKRGDGRGFYALFNLLFLEGYLPEATYYSRHEERRIWPDEAYIESFMEHSLTEAERTEENRRRLQEWFKDHADVEGMVKTVNDSCYGRLLWDVRSRAGA